MQGKIIGTGLIALDVILNGRIETPPKVFAGGSCGNVLTILSFLGNESFPIARLADNKYTDLLFDDLSKWDVNTSLISRDDDGNTPIIIHRIQKDKDGNPKHRFEFRNPLSGQWFPNYKPVLSKSVEQISAALPLSPKAFYFDRVNRASIELAKICKKRGAIVVFEPSSLKMDKLFLECLEVSHIIKFSNERIKNYSEQFPNNKVPLEIETLGSQGLKYRFKSDEWKIINSFFIENIFDTAGAGDWCTAGLINILGDSGLDSFNSAKQEIIEYSLLYGQALGALNCMFDGARGLMYNINKSEIDILVNNMLLGENNRTHLMDINLNNKNKITLNKKFELSDIF
jgi:fructokinase